MAQVPVINLGILGLGVVGQGVLKHLKQKRKLLESRLGVRLRVKKAAVRNLTRTRKVKLPAKQMTTDGYEVVRDPSIQVVCELIGGTGLARELTLEALRHGKVVVTANKALLCEHGEEVLRVARENGGHIFFEASVAGGIPIIKAIREGLVANRFPAIHGILNGTCNYILSRMQYEGLPFDQILKEAKELGYAEADESLDVDGIDAAHKAGILAYLAHGFWVPLERMIIGGIRDIDTSDISAADAMGYRIKHLATVKNDGDDNLFVGVYPALVSKSHILGRVDDVFNAVCVSGDVVGTTAHIGKGAGQDATASAVISDIADAVFTLRGKGLPNLIDDENDPLSPADEKLSLSNLKQVCSKFYLRLTVADEPGVLARIASVMAKCKISIERVIQNQNSAKCEAMLMLTTHSCSEYAMDRALKELSKLTSTKDAPFRMRIVELED